MIDLSGLLERTSRTFALSIPRLPEPTRRATTLAYLLFRIADTFEDAAAWPRAARIQALLDFDELLGDANLALHGVVPPVATVLAEAWTAAHPADHDGYAALVAATPEVLAALADLDVETRAAVIHHARRTAQGMRTFVERSDARGGLRLASLPELRSYCYVVAGIGGELEPLQATPVVIEDNCFIGARAEVAEGVIVGTGAVLSMGVYLGASTKIVDRATGEIHIGRVPPYSVVVPGALPGKPLPDGTPGPSLYCAVIVKTVDAQTRAKTGINELLRD